MIQGGKNERLLEPLMSGHGWLGGCGDQLAFGIGMLVLTLYRFAKLVGKEVFVGWYASFECTFPNICKIFGKTFLVEADIRIPH